MSTSAGTPKIRSACGLRYVNVASVGSLAGQLDVADGRHLLDERAVARLRLAALLLRALGRRAVHDQTLDLEGPPEGSWVITVP